MTSNLQALKETFHVKGHVADPTDYFTQIMPLHEVYGIHARLDGADFLLTVVFSRSMQTSQFTAPYSAGEEFFRYVETRQDSIESTYDATAKVDHYGTLSTLWITKAVRNSFAPMIEAGGISEEVRDFISKAYRSGVSMTISGVTGAGKTSFLNTLIESNQDGKETVVLSTIREMIFNTENRRLSELTSETGDLISAALALGHQRIIIDEYYPGIDELNTLFTENKDKQFIYTTHHTPIALSTGAEDGTSVIRVEGDHDFELRIDLEMTHHEENGVKTHTPAVVAVHEIVKTPGAYFIWTLFSRNEKVHEPTSVLAGKMGLAQKA